MDILEFIAIFLFTAVLLFLVSGLLFLLIHYSGTLLIYYAKKYRWAITFYTYKIKLAPMFSSSYIHRSRAYLSLKQYEQVIQDCDKALALNAKAPMAYHNRGAAYWQLKHYQTALQNFDQALALKQDFALAYRNRGMLYFHLKEDQKALQDCDRAIALNPKILDFYFSRGRVLISLKEYQRALQDFNQAILLKPTTACSSYHNRGFCYLHLNNLEQGRTDCLTAQKLHPAALIHSWMVEYCQLCLEKPDLATAERLEKLTMLRVSPNAADLRYLCSGVALWLREQYQEAYTKLEQGLKVKPDSASSYFWMGMTCASLGKEEEARKAVEHALELGLPRVLLTPLKLLPEKQLAFFDQYAESFYQYKNT